MFLVQMPLHLCSHLDLIDNPEIFTLMNPVNPVDDYRVRTQYISHYTI